MEPRPTWTTNPHPVLVHDAMPAMADVISGATHRPEPLAPGEDVHRWAMNTHAWLRALIYIAGDADVQHNWTPYFHTKGDEESEREFAASGLAWILFTNYARDKTLFVDLLAGPGEESDNPDVTLAREVFCEPAACVLALENGPERWLIALNEDGTRACTVHLDAGDELPDSQLLRDWRAAGDRLADDGDVPDYEPPDWSIETLILTTAHAASSYGRPVLVLDDEAYGPADLLPDGTTAASLVHAWAARFAG